MKKEIETRFLEIDKDELICRLRKMGAEDRGETTLNEIIFYDKKLKWLNENKLARLRKRNGKITLTYKENKKQKTDSAKEIEFEVSDFGEAKDLLEALGLIPYRIVEKIRHTFILDDVILDIDTWPRIPTYVEFEGKSVKALQDLAKKLEFEWKKRFDGDPRYVYKKYGFNFDKLKIVTFNKFE
ncbi:MAG: class IV adenylate cyclase [bacterium]